MCHMRNAIMGRNVGLYKSEKKGLNWSNFPFYSAAVSRPPAHLHLPAFNSLWQWAMERSEKIVLLLYVLPANYHTAKFSC